MPRDLLGGGIDLLVEPVNEEGLLPVKISWSEGHVFSLNQISRKSGLPSNFLLPRFVEPHVHLDKAFTWKDYPNHLGTYSGALRANLAEHNDRTKEDVVYRVERALEDSLRHGIRAIRTHIDSFTFDDGEIWEALICLKDKWKSLIQLEFVALVPLEFWSTKNGKLFASHVANAGGLLGGVVVPPIDKMKLRSDLSHALLLAKEQNCG